MEQLTFPFYDEFRPDLLDRIKAAADNGKSIRQLSRELKIPIERLFRAAHQAGIRYKHRRQSPETIARAIALVADQGLTMRAAGKAVGMSKTAVHRFVLKQRQRMVDSAGPVRFQRSAETGGRQRRWQCPVHGTITVWPCVACVAEEGR